MLLIKKKVNSKDPWKSWRFRELRSCKSEHFRGKGISSEKKKPSFWGGEKRKVIPPSFGMRRCEENVFPKMAG
jgi:hypothetical protein